MAEVAIELLSTAFHHYLVAPASLLSRFEFPVGKGVRWYMKVADQQVEAEDGEETDFWETNHEARMYDWEWRQACRME